MNRQDRIGMLIIILGMFVLAMLPVADQLDMRLPSIVIVIPPVMIFGGLLLFVLSE